MDHSEPERPLRIAIACPGVGLVQRGYERLFHDLFKLMEDEVDITLFKGGGAVSEHEKVPFFTPRNGRFLKLLPVHHLMGRTPIHVECLTFALAMVPYLRGDRFDVVHCVDPPLVRILYKLRRLLGLRFRLLYTHACTMPPTHYPPADHLQQASQATHQEALDAGIAADAMTLVPLGIHPGKFDTARTRQELRREYRIPEDAFVILSVAALNRSHKRTHYLVDEAAKLRGNFLLWLDGSMDQGEPDLIGYARSRLGDRCRITQVPTAKVGELYRMADVMAHTAVFEAFGLSIVEAASAGLPVLIHEAPHFRWLLSNPKAWVDMSSPSALADRLSALMANPELLREIGCREQVRQRFDWDVLKRDYRAMYERVSKLAPAGQGGAGKNYFWQLHR